METSYNIVIATDNNYAPHAAICIKSFILNNQDAPPTHFHILDNNLNNESKEWLELSLRKDDSISYYSISNIRNLLKVPVPDRISITTYARMFIGSILPDSFDKVLYLDCDIVINANLKDLFEIQIEPEIYIVGVLDAFLTNNAKTEIGIPSDSPYINAGVLLVSLNHWRKNNLENRFIEFLLNKNGDVKYDDQGILNAVCHGHKKIIHPKYNVYSTIYSHSYKLIKKHNNPIYSKQEYKDAKTYPTIIHFTSGVVNRPWVEHCVHPLKSKYITLKKSMPFSDLPLLKDSRNYRERINSWMLRNTCIFIYNFYQNICKCIYNIRK